MSAANVERLPVRSEPAPCENLAGYVMRLASLNHRPPGPLWVEVMSAARRSSDAAVSLVSGLAGCAPGIVEPLLSHGPERNPTWRPVPGIDIAPYLADLRARVCPGCLSRRRVAHAAWNVAHYVGCAEHGRYLVDRCPRCARKLGMHRMNVATCACGFDLAGAESRRMPPAETEVAGLILAACSGGLGRESPPSCPADLELPDLLRMILWVGCSPAVSIRSGTGLDTEERRRGIVTKAAPVLANWPLGMRDHLRRLVVETPDAKAAKDSRHFLDGLNSGTKDADWPGRDIVVAQVAAVSGGHRLGTAVAGLVAGPDEPHVSRWEAGRILGVDAVDVPAFARRNGIRLLRIRWGSRHAERYNVSDLEAAKNARDAAHALRSDWFTAAVVAAMLGLTSQAVRELSELGLLAAKRIGRYVYYRGTDAEELLADLARRADGRLAGRDAVPIPASEISFGKSPSRLLHLVLSGKLSVATVDDGLRDAADLRSYVLDHEEAVEAVRAMTGSVTFGKAAEELGIGKNQVPQLCAAGLLVEAASPKANARLVTCESLAAFAARYTHTAEVMRRSPHVQTRNQSIDRQLGAIGIPAVRKFSLRFCVYERSDVGRALGWDTAADAAAKSD